MTRIYRLHNHTSIKFTQQPANYGSMLAWDSCIAALGFFSFMAALAFLYIIF